MAGTGDHGVQSVLGPFEPEEDNTVAGLAAMEKNNVWLADQLEDWEQENSE